MIRDHVALFGAVLMVVSLSGALDEPDELTTRTTVRPLVRTVDKGSPRPPGARKTDLVFETINPPGRAVVE